MLPSFAFEVSNPLLQFVQPLLELEGITRDADGPFLAHTEPTSPYTSSDRPRNAVFALCVNRIIRFPL